MISLHYSEIPTYLHSGLFYRSLNVEETSVLEVPADCFLSDGELVLKLEEFSQLLRVMTFWILDEIPLGIILFCDRIDIEVWRDAVENLPDQDISRVLLAAFSEINVHDYDIILELNRWELIVYVIDRDAPEQKLDTYFTARAGRLGNLRVLTFLHARGYALHEEICSSAGSIGHLECLQFGHEHGCPWDIDVYLWAAQCGYLACMQYAHQHGLEWDGSVCVNATICGQFACLKFAHENGCPWDVRVLIEAAGQGHLDCLEYAHQQGLQWCPEVCSRAAQSGQLPCLQFALQYGCPVDSAACIEASQFGHIQCLQLLHQYNAPWDEATTAAAAEQGGTECLQYLHENGCPWDSQAPYTAASNGHILTLRYMMEHGCPYDHALVPVAACARSLPCVRYLVEECHLSVADHSHLLITLLLRGDVSCLAYLLEKGCAYIDVTFGGELSWEQYDLLLGAEKDGFVRCVEYAVECGWSIDSNLIGYMRHLDSETCNDFLHCNGLV